MTAFLMRVRSIACFLLMGVLGLALVPIQDANAQGPSLRSAERPVRVSIDPTFQRYETEEGQVLTQLSSHLNLFVPIGRRFGVRARAGYAQMGGGDLTTVQGPTDVSVGVTYAQPVGDGSVVMSLEGNAPTGKQELDTDELATTRLIGQDFYDFRVSSFSRGFSLSPRVTWAVPITDRFAVGIGAGYQYQQGFRPQATLNEDYVPGDGIGVNGGFDYKITQNSAIGLDLAFKRYSADQLGGEDRFNAGNRMAGTIRYLWRSGFTSVRVLARYTRWQESTFRYQAPDGPITAQVLPSNGMAMASAGFRLSEIVRLKVRGSGHLYQQSLQSGDGKVFGRAYVSPSFKVGEVLTIAPHGTVAYGSYLGLGGGLRLEGEF